MQKNAEANGNFEYSIYFTNAQTYALLISDYLYIKAALLKLLCRVDFELIDELATRGYKVEIPTQGPMDVASIKYAASIYKLFRRCENILTKISVKRNELLESLKGKESEASSFDSVIAQLAYHWPGAALPEDITLSRYNECVKLVKAKNQKQKLDGRFEQ